jgi:hypothetical protein
MVNFSGISIDLEEIEHFLKKNLQLKEVCQQILYQKIIDQAVHDHKLTLTEEEIRMDAEGFRREKRLEKARDTFTWLADQMVAPDDWEKGIQDRLLRKKLAETLFSKQVEKFFVENRLNFDQLSLYQIIVPYQQLAWEIFYQIEEEEMSFYQAAHLYDIDEQRRYQCGYEGRLYRWSLKPEIATIIFNAQPGKVIPPISTEQGYHLLLVEEFIAAELTPETYEEILHKLFDEWLQAELNYLLHNSGETKITNITNYP